MNFEQHAADLSRFIKVLDIAKDARDAFVLAGQVHASLAVEQTKLAGMRAEQDAAQAALAAAREAIAAEQAASARTLEEHREHVAAAQAAVKLAMAQRDAVLADQATQLKVAEEESRAVVAEDVRLAAEATRLFLLDAEAAEARIAAAKSAAAQLLKD